MKQDGVAANARDFLIFVETAIFMRKYLFLIGLIVLLGCNQKRQKPPYLLVELAGRSASSIQLQYLLKDFQPFDTAAVNDKGMWEFIKDSVPAGFYQLVVDSKPISRLVISDEAPTRIKISDEESTVSIVGSPETKAIVQIERIVAKLSGDINKVASSFHDSLPADQFVPMRDSLLNRIEGLKANCRDKLDGIYQAHTGSLVQLAVLYQQAGNHQLYDPVQDASFYFLTDSLLKGRYPDYQPVVEFHHKVDSLRRLKQMMDLTAAGKRMPAFELPNAWGEMVSFSTYAGKNTLVVAWTSTSEISRNATRDLFRLTRSYRRQGLSVLMISLDTEATAWKKAIREDRLPFVHLCDLKGERSPIVQQLGISHQPLFWVVDSAGVIKRRTRDMAEALNELSLIIKN